MQAELIERFAAIVRRRTGLDVSGHRRDDLLRALAELEPRHHSVERMCAELESGTRTPLFADVVRALTIGETTFFRHPEQFRLLTSQVLSPLIARRRAEGSLRLQIWSAGCATGEEPHSIALALARLLPEPAAWQLSLLATDLNPDFLAAARDAAYGEWSFRGCEPHVRDRFTREGKQWRLDATVRTLVTFSPLNLVDDEYPSDVDVIFCRNVLIYFDAETRHRVVTRLRNSLAPEGWLIVGHADLGIEEIDGLAQRFGPESFVFQRCDARPAVPVVAPRAGASSPLVSRHEAPARPKTRIAPRREPDARALFDNAARLLDRGDDEAAADALRRSLYLDPRQPAAHYMAGLIAARRGSGRNATRHFRAAMVTLSALDDTAVVDGTDGITAGRLRQTLDTLLRRFTEEVLHA